MAQDNENSRKETYLTNEERIKIESYKESGYSNRAPQTINNAINLDTDCTMK